ncbi:MAG TPA: hypothetical protein PLW02_00350 [Verrucomicrobiota bacterium]|nr:hypothetical protein [Verrucomicrobiota bacterium]
MKKYNLFPSVKVLYLEKCAISFHQIFTRLESSRRRYFASFVSVKICLMFLLGLTFAVQGELIWVEGENPTVNRMNRHPWWYDLVNREELSGGDFISNFSKEKVGEAEYRFNAPADGEYEFWLHANPVKSRLTYSLNGAPAVEVDFKKDVYNTINIAADGKPDLRFIAWIKVGKVTLKKGENRILFNTASPQENHGIIDCFVFSKEALTTPPAITSPADSKNWFGFAPEPDKFDASSAIDMRFLNEKFAGEHGFIGVKNGDFIHQNTGEPVRFWAVNGPPHDLKGDQLKRCARLMAKYGINLVRVHGGLFDKDGEVDPEKVRHAQEIVAAMKPEGIYTHFSIYFPLWFTPRPDHPWLKGYNGKQHPFAALEFNPIFQEKYREWVKALITPLLNEPAVFGIEIQNEDSFFFWTFDAKNIPDPQLQILEKMFGDWLIKKYGSLDAAFKKWGGKMIQRDAPAEGRVGFRPLWNIFSEKTARDQDTAAFLLEVQTKFYADIYRYLRQLGFKGVITASNWTTASPEVFGPLEKLSYTVTDFIDRHGYFECNRKGDSADWSIRNGQTYSDRSAYRFDAETPGKPRQFVHPAMDPHYNNLPSMISEIAWCRPNRFRSEAPIYLAAYGALQHSDTIVQFAFDGDRWTVKPRYFMQPWTIMSPATMGQFPAAAILYRRGLVSVGNVLAEINLNKDDLIHLKGTPLPQEAAVDELRLKDIPEGSEIKPGQRIDPLIHYAGRVNVNFTSNPGSVKLTDTRPFINHAAQIVTSSTGELKLDYGKGYLIINAPRAQGVSGNVKSAGLVQTKDLTISSELDLCHIIAVALDDQPLSNSKKILLQVMSEEKNNGFRTTTVSTGVKQITNIGSDPWLVKELNGTVSFKRADAENLKVSALDYNGYPVSNAGSAKKITLQPKTVYYLIAP